jgi:hypothetical protein
VTIIKLENIRECGYMDYTFIGLIALTAVIVLCVIVKSINAYRRRKFIEKDIAWQIHRAREMGVPMKGIRFDENYSLIDPRTGKPVVYGSKL